MMLGQRNIPRQHCPLCNQEQDVIVNGQYIEDGQVQFDKTNGFAFCNCNNIFFNNWTNIEQAIYDADYTKKYESEACNRYLKQYAKAYMPIIQEHKVNGSVLEIGCINKTLLDCFKAEEYDTYSLDIIEHKWDGHKNITADFETYVPCETFAVIWASHVFEHFKNPIKALEQSYKLLEPNGLLFVAMPDPYFIDWKNPYTWGHWHLREHYTMWDLDSFCKVLESIGFNIILKIHNTGTSFICTGDFHVIAKK